MKQRRKIRIWLREEAHRSQWRSKVWGTETDMPQTKRCKKWSQTHLTHGQSRNICREVSKAWPQKHQETIQNLWLRTHVTTIREKRNLKRDMSLLDNRENLIPWPRATQKLLSCPQMKRPSGMRSYWIKFSSLLETEINRICLTIDEGNVYWSLPLSRTVPR